MAWLLIGAAPFIFQQSQDLIVSLVRANTTEQTFNNYFDGLQRNPVNNGLNQACGNRTANVLMGVVGYDCNHWDQFDHTIAEREAAAAAAAAEAAQAEADAAFAANFDAAWSAHMPHRLIPRLKSSSWKLAVRPPPPIVTDRIQNFLPEYRGFDQWIANTRENTAMILSEEYLGGSPVRVYRTRAR